MITIHFSPLEALPNAEINSEGPVSKAFLGCGMTTFHQAACYVMHLPYGANSSSDNATVLFEEGVGTCTTKHGVIARLAEELELPVSRCEGFYPLTGQVVTGVDAILAEYGLPYIPRIHCFLACKEYYVDLTAGNCTGKNGPIETYLKIFRVPPEQTESETDETYRKYYVELCKGDPVFARLGVDGMLEALGRCITVNTVACQRVR